MWCEKRFQPDHAQSTGCPHPQLHAGGNQPENRWTHMNQGRSIHQGSGLVLSVISDHHAGEISSFRNPHRCSWAAVWWTRSRAEDTSINSVTAQFMGSPLHRNMMGRLTLWGPDTGPAGASDSLHRSADWGGAGSCCWSYNVHHYHKLSADRSSIKFCPPRTFPELIQTMIPFQNSRVWKFFCSLLSFQNLPWSLTSFLMVLSFFRPVNIFVC